MTAERAPRPYSTLRDGKIVWIYPGETAPTKKVRSRPETDGEVRARIDAAVKARRKADPFWIWYREPGRSSRELEIDLRDLGLPPRQMIDEEVA